MTFFLGRRSGVKKKFKMVESLRFQRSWSQCRSLRKKYSEPELEPVPEPVKKKLGAGAGQKWTGSATLPIRQHYWARDARLARCCTFYSC